MMSQLWCFYVILHGVWIVVGECTNIVVHDNVHDFPYLTICFMIHPYICQVVLGIEKLFNSQVCNKMQTHDAFPSVQKRNEGGSLEMGLGQTHK